MSDEPTRTVLVSSTARTGPTQRRGLRLSVLSGDSSKSVTIAQTVAVVGRSPAAELQLGAPTVSSMHAEFEALSDGIRVRDLDSTNGITYAGARIRDAIVPSGATVSLGEVLLRVEHDEPIANSTAPMSFGELRGRSSAMRELFSVLSRVAPTELTVLIDGPTGTGKELAARALHEHSKRSKGPFIVLDCTAIPSSLAESVLFGHEKGAFTGASERRKGAFESAMGGTLFLDEIGELTPELQPKLLRVLERRECVRVGGTQPVPLDVRVLAATWRNLRAMTNDGRFREDLYYRLAQVRVRLPALSERPEDIPVLVRHFLDRVPTSREGARDIMPEAMEALLRREFPGNIRELRGVVERASALAAGPIITPEELLFERLVSEPKTAERVSRTEERTSLPPPSAPDHTPMELFKDAKRTFLEDFEHKYLQKLLERAGNNLTLAAAMAGVERHHLRQLLRKHGLRDG